MALGKKIMTVAGMGVVFLMFLFAQLSESFALEQQTAEPLALEQQAANYEKVIAHGGGCYKGYESSNSVEALQQAISNGYRMIELDMELSSDHRIIMLHDWDRTAQHYFGVSFEKKISQNQFMNLSVYGELEVLTFDKLAKILEKHDDIRIVTDTKGDNMELLKKISEEYPDLVSRIIPQIYDYSQWSPAKELGYRDIIFTLYAMPELDTEKLASFVKENGIYAVTMPDYLAERGICKLLSDKGIIVYVHPVSDYEGAMRYMEQGAYGVYSGALLPEEFTGIEKEYYLSGAGGDFAEEKLSDARIHDLRELKICGLQEGQTTVWMIDETLPSTEEAVSELKQGKHRLTVKIYSKKELLGSLDYYLWKDGEKQLRVVHKKYGYRLEEGKPGKVFDSVMLESEVQDSVREILENSLIAKKGESAFYFNGKTEYYKNGEEFLPVQKESSGKLLLPLNTTMQRFGADSVTMSRTKDLTVIYNNERSMIMAGSSLIRKGFRIMRIKSPVALYLNKAMAGGGFFQCITGRNYLEKDDMLIILPNGLKTDKEMDQQIVSSARELF